MNTISDKDFLILICSIYLALFLGAILIAYVKDKFNL